MPARKRKRTSASNKKNNLLVIYKVSIFTALVIVISAFLVALLTPLITNTAVSILGASTSFTK